MYLLLDIGGTNIKLATSSDGRTISEPMIVPTPTDFEKGMQVIEQTVPQLVGGGRMQAIGAGVAGVLNPEHSTLIKAPHLPNWINKPLKRRLEAVFGISLKLDNDVALGGLGEANFGQYKDEKIIAYIAIGTGVGGVRIVDSQIDRNSQGFEPGHQIIVPDGNVCNCGGKGHLEAYVSGAYLKDPVNWDEVAKYLALGLHNTIVHWSPDLVLLGGSVTESLPKDRIVANLTSLLTIFPAVPKIDKATLGNRAGLLGALKLLS